MRFSAFTRFGHLRFSSQKPIAQVIYERMVVALGGEEMVANGGEGIDQTIHARLYAHAMALATARRNFDRVRGNASPETAVELLPYWERVYGQTPLPGDSDDVRRAALAEAQRVAQGCRHDVILDVMQRLLGDSLVAVKTLGESEYTVAPANWSTPATRPGTWKPATTIAKRRSIRRSIHTTGSLSVATQHVGGATAMFVVGDTLVVEPGLLGRQEAVTVTAVSGESFTATFAKAHPAGSLVLTEPWPTATTTSRHLLIVTTSAVARSSAWRKKIYAKLNRLLRATDTYDVVEESSSGQLGPFYPGEGVPAVTPLVQTSS